MAKADARPRVLAFLRRGLHRTDAARAAGITYKTFREWELADGAFREAVKKAEADSREALVERIQAAAEDPKHWTAAAWLLERRSPKRWGRKDRVDVKQLAPEQLTDEQLAAELEKALAALRKGAA